MSQEDKNKKNPPSGSPSPDRGKNTPNSNRSAQMPRPGRAAFVWLAILLGIGVMLLFKGYQPAEIRELSQSEFEILLKEKKIASANLSQENGQICIVEGRLIPLSIEAQKSSVPASAKSSEKPEASAAEAGNVSAPKYRARIVLSEALKAQLASDTLLTVEPNNAGFWNVIWMGILPVLLLVGAIYFISARQARSMGGKGMFDFGKSKARMLSPDEINVKFDDIAGADEAKADIQEIVEFLKDPIRFQLVGGRIPKGCLLVGEPGTGKTLMAKAVACEAGVPFFSISGSDFVEMFVGVGASRVRDMFEQARRHTPCLIFIDEIDAVGRSRFSGWGGGHDEREQTLNAMLVEMDGLESRNGVIVLAATNRPDVLDPALLRPGRFDRQVVMDLPDINGRKKILEVHIAKVKTTSDISLDVLARTTPGFSGADLANLCNEAALLAARRGKEAVTQSELEEARDKVSYGSERRSRKITDRERKLTAYHEAGHTIVALHNEHCTPVHKVTIIPRGQAYLGATFTMPKEDVYTRSKLELEAEMSMSMGGRAAEELIFGDITTGASADINQLTSIARKMVCLFGMSEKVGPAKLWDFSIHPHLRIDGPQPDPISPETAREIDLEIRRLVETALNSARTCLQEHRDELEKLAQALLERETLSVDEIRELFGWPPLNEPEQSVSAEPAVPAEQDATIAPAETADASLADDGTGQSNA